MRVVRIIALCFIAGLLCQMYAVGAVLTWDANTGSAGAQDGSGAWASNQWWNGSANVTWNNGPSDNAVIGVGGSGGEITLGSAEAGHVAFSDFSGIYTLLSGSLIMNDGCVIGPQTDSQSVKLSGATVTTSATVFIGSNNYASAANNTLAIENGGQLLGGGDVVIGHKLTPGGGSYNVGGAGAASYASNGVVYVAWNSNNEKLNVSNAFLSVSALNIGYSPAGNGRAISGNSATVDSQGTLEVRGGGAIRIGTHNNYNARSDNNTLLVKNGGLASSGGQLQVGATSQGANNNRALVMSGGRLTTAGAIIGKNGTNNSVHVIGSALGNSVWDLTGANISFQNLRGMLEVDGGGIIGGASVTNIGTLSVSVSNTLSLGSGGRVYANTASLPGELAVNLDESVNSDSGQLLVSGSLDLSGATLDISGKKRGIYVLAEYGSLVGGIAVTNGIQVGDKIDYDYLGRNQVVLVAPARGTVLILY